MRSVSRPGQLTTLTPLSLLTRSAPDRRPVGEDAKCRAYRRVGRGTGYGSLLPVLLKVEAPPTHPIASDLP